MRRSVKQTSCDQWFCLIARTLLLLFNDCKSV